MSYSRLSVAPWVTWVRFTSVAMRHCATAFVRGYLSRTAVPVATSSTMPLPPPLISL